jgi:hypothetical protein
MFRKEEVMDFEDLLVALVLGICAIGLGFGVFRHFVGEGSYALTIAAAGGIAVAVGYVIWQRRLFFSGRGHRH